MKSKSRRGPYDDPRPRTLASVDPENAGKLQELESRVQQAGGDWINWRAATVQIDEKSFGLSLGWRISPTTQKIVSLLMGEPDLCRPGLPAAGASKAASARTLRANSCVMRAVVNLLDQPTPP